MMPPRNGSAAAGPPVWGRGHSGMTGEREVPDRRAPRRGRPEHLDDRLHRGRETPIKEDPYRKVKIVVVAVATVILLAILPFWISSLWADEGGSDGTVLVQDRFAGVSSRVLMNTTYTGRDTYFTIPGGSEIEKAFLRLSGSLPPQKVSFQTGRNPMDLAVGDIDGDLYMEVVVANNKDDKVMVMNNHGDGLVRGDEYSVGRGPVRVELRELNDDGYLDLLVLSEDSRELRVLLNDQIGGFRVQGQPFGFDTLPADMAVLDFDGDGYNDTAVITTNNDRLTLFRNNGLGMLEYHSNFTTEGNPTRIAVADMDQDGRDDIVISNRRDVSDMKGEKHQISVNDRMVTWLSTVSVWMNKGGGNFIREFEDLRTQKGVSSMEPGDLNGDGYPDIVMSNLGYHNVSLLLSDNLDFKRGTPGEMDSILLGSMDPIQVKLVDIDVDNELDIIAVTKSADSVLVYHGTGMGTFDPYIQYYVGLNPTSLELMDYDSDGDMDIVTSDWKGWIEKNGENGTVSILTNLRSGIFGTYSQYPTGNSPRGVFVRDVDGDGDIDLATANYFGSTVSILKNDGLGHFSKKHMEYPIGLEPYAVVMEDFDDDGFMDGASADEANFRIVLMESDTEGGFTSQRYLYDIGAYPFSLRSGDIDNDGDIDLLTSNYFQSSTTLLFNDGSGDFATMFSDYRTIYLGSEMPYDSIMEDFNGDGYKDLVTTNRGDSLDPTDTMTVMLNDGTFSFTEGVSYKVGKEPTSSVVHDIDGDGDLDIATANTGSDSISVMLNDGSGVFEKLGDYPAGDRPQYIEVLDFDGDGWMDYITTNTDSNDIVFIRNLGSKATFRRDMVLNIASYPYAIDTGDFNSDGREDIVLSAVNTNCVIVTGCYWYPSDVSLDIGADGSIDHTFPGPMTGDRSYDVDITEEVTRYLKENDIEGDVKVPVRVIAGEEGVVVLDDLIVLFR
ncbi:MAG: VCBS repeat-containing protein [Candidatus Thermoplasmatota archaeon]|nr:VCBS repeat-containing protein [Candidatus Thermoplasmatota archaeon]